MIHLGSLFIAIWQFVINFTIKGPHNQPNHKEQQNRADEEIVDEHIDPNESVHHLWKVIITRVINLKPDFTVDAHSSL